MHVPSVECPALQNVSNLYHNKWHDFRRKTVIEFKMRVLITSSTFFLKHSTTNSARCDKKKSLFLSDFN